ncbi:MAG: hypothetical protein M0Z87_02070 [Actinomycetota bacterium]|nr:hypothetical protein [Actinomycetota bacterium]
MAEPGMVVRIAGVEVDIPRSVGFYGAIAAAVAVGAVEPPLGVFIACVPLAKMALHSRSPGPLKWLGQVLDGAAKPVGGDAEGTIRLTDPDQAMKEAAYTKAKADQAPPRIKAVAAREAAQDAAEVSGS